MSPKTFDPRRHLEGTYIPGWLWERTELSATAKYLWTRLDELLGGKGQKDYVFPSREWLANETGISERKATRCIAELVAHELIRTERCKKTNKPEKQKGVKYWLLWHRWSFGGRVYRPDRTIVIPDTIKHGDVMTRPRRWMGTFIPSWLMKRTDLSAGDKMFYIAFTRCWSKHDGYATVRSQDTLSKKFGMNQQAFGRHLNRLCGAGLISEGKVKGKAVYVFLDPFR